MLHPAIDRLIINSPYEEPARRWRYGPASKRFELAEGRRPAGYVVATPGSKAFDNPGLFVEIPLVNQIHPRLKAWRQAGYPGVTKRLLEHWQDPENFDRRRFFFCQLEAVETLIWLTEATPAERAGIEIPGDGGDFVRQCCQMATGAGKTIVMAMVIAWQVLNKVANPQDARFAKNVLAIAPGLTVKKRLEALYPAAEGNYYEASTSFPRRCSTNCAKARRWCATGMPWIGRAKNKSKSARAWTSAAPRAMKPTPARYWARWPMRGTFWSSTTKRTTPGASTGEAEGKRLRARDLKDSAEKATVWIGGLDRLHRSRGILRCYDFSATPFAPSGGKSGAETLFGWIGLSATLG